MQIPDSAPFSLEQKTVLDRLFGGLDPAQLQWISGYLAGFLSSSSPLASTATAAPSASAPSLTILFGSESGNAQSLADEARRFATQAGFHASVKDMSGLSASDLPRESTLLVITSTWGDGEPPVNAEDLYKSISSESAPQMQGVSFSVCALGDTSYDKFCQTGKDFDRRLEELGATRIHPRADCDVDYEPTFRAWLHGIFDHLQKSAGSQPQQIAVAGSATTLLPSHAAPSYGKSHPFPASLRQKVLLSGRGSTKEVWHLEFSIASSGLHYEPGDSIAVIPTNSPDAVESLLAATRFRHATIRGEENANIPLFDLLQSSYDITTLSKPLATKYNEFARSAKLEQLLHDPADWQTYLHGRHIVDLLEEFPVPNLSPEDFIGILRKLPPRYYSVASSQRAHPDEVHLTVAAVRFESHGRQRKGVASTCLADIVEIGATAPVYVVQNKNFKLPADSSAPVILIGPGTGVAPFRAFIQERTATGAKGKNWLFFGDQHYTTDFLYQLEWQEALKEGILTHLEVAFSRDQKKKIYVQHRMEEHGAELWKWLQNGAYVYVCGNASHMAPDVHEALLRIVEVCGQRSRDEAEAYVEDLRKTKRYQRDVY